MKKRRSPEDPTAALLPYEFSDLLDELGVYYGKVEVTLTFERRSKALVDMVWHCDCSVPLSLITLPAVSFNRIVDGNRVYNLASTLYGFLYGVLDAVLADIEQQTKIVVFPV